ncbi:hypothetical protein PV08_06702 [Exophiala spinifera]|uniref:Pentacotripeptide-repeat region of PRORP domain-containing protein n=1 Tax=Exophiala spinifera TaxID=91928 RepID=A0A0D1YFW1_9EURO|nr:uncharacterized protein PV08_06702 [Exophiala spinifera]KIW13921.1 hypothetical protein PV08_06702 [Exophiala spinifera]
MLERTSQCIEPASQLFLRTVDPPIRSSRPLGQAFWRNRGNDLVGSAWWPLYLRDLRSRYQQKDQAPHRLAQRPGKPSSLNSRPTKHNAFPVRSVAAANLNRGYTNNAQPAPSMHGFVHGEVRPEDSILYLTDRSSRKPHIPFNKTDTEVEEELGRLLAGKPILDQALQEFSSGDIVFALFQRLSHPGAYASAVFHFLAQTLPLRDPEPRLIKGVHEAFNSIPLSERTARDYTTAVKVSLKVDDFRLVQRINAEATSRDLNHECSPFLLLHFVTNMLWRNAVEIWTTSYITRRHDHHMDSLVSQASDYRDLPDAINKLASSILERSPVLMRFSGKLRSIARKLLHVLLRNGRLMSLITPSGLLGTLNNYHLLGQLHPRMHLEILNTLLKYSKRPNKSGLGTLVYRNLRLNFPDYKPPPSAYGALLSMHADDASSLREYEYCLREFTHVHGAADKKSYQKVLTALARQGDVVGVQTIFGQLCQAHSRPKEIEFYTPLIYVYARLGDVEKAEREFERLKLWGIEPNTYCWNMILYSHIRSRHPKTAFDRFGDMQAQGVCPDKYTFGTLMSTVSRSGDTEQVLSMIERVQQLDPRGNYEMMSALIHSYCLNNQADTAERLAEATSKAGYMGNPVKMWNYILRHYAFRRDSTACLRVQHRMQALGIKPDDMTYAALMTALVALGKTKDAAQILRRLNLSQALTANPFHYSIILHGFALEGNRDMATIVYQEMLQRFPNLGGSPHLAMLHLESRRSPEAKQSPQLSVDFLAEILETITTADRASKLPQPGLRRRRAVDALPSIYFEHLVGILLAKGRVEQADKLLRRFESLAGLSFLDVDVNFLDSKELLVSRLRVAAQGYDWEGVEKIWVKLLQGAIQAASERKASKAQQPSVGVEFLKSEPGSEFSSMIPDFASRTTSDDESKILLSSLSSNILPAQRFILKDAINIYLGALDFQHRHNHAVVIVELLQKAGFSLSNSNWNAYIQTLTRSRDWRHWVEAFRIFEEKMYTSAPAWRLLVRGKALIPNDSELQAGAKKLVRRKDAEKVNMDLPMPTYLTAVCLATVLKKSGVRTRLGDDALMLELSTAAPETYRYIRRIPRLKDKFQGTLLRDFKIAGDIPKRPRNSAPPDRAGVLGSFSPLDHVPVGELGNLDEIINGQRYDRDDDVPQAERIEGQVDRSPQFIDREDRHENDLEYQERIYQHEARLLDTMDVIRRDASRLRTVSDSWFGQPDTTSTTELKEPRHTDLPPGALLNPFYASLERRVERERKLREELDRSLQDAGEKPRRATRARNTQVLPQEPKRHGRLQAFVPGSTSPSTPTRLRKNHRLLERLPRVAKLPPWDRRVKAAWHGRPKRKWRKDEAVEADKTEKDTAG